MRDFLFLRCMYNAFVHMLQFMTAIGMAFFIGAVPAIIISILGGSDLAVVFAWALVGLPTFMGAYSYLTGSEI